MAIYIHIPFCASKCTYCAFYSVASPAWMERFVDALQAEIAERANYLPCDMEHGSLYLGGGTPSVLPEPLFRKMMTTVLNTFHFTRNAERTIEVNPEDVTPSRAAMWRSAGFNRVSMGIQSFDDEVLKRIKRRHSGAGALQAIAWLKEAGFERISGDLIVGLPGSSASVLERDVRLLAEQGIGHISVYMLSVDERTELEIQVKRGIFTPLEDDELTDRFEQVCDMLSEYGYEHYEISNFALAGQRAVHNTAYWKGHVYAGYGPAAHSYNGDCRHWGVASVKRYVEALERNEMPIEEELLTDADRYNERIMTGLRMKEGVTDCEMEQLNAKAWQESLNYRKYCVSSGYALWTEHGFALTPKGWLLSDKIFSELFC